MDTIRVVKNIKAMAFRKQAIYIPTVEACSTEEKAYCNAYALNTFGIVFSNPGLASKNVIRALSEQIPINVPKSFYNNPQDLTHFSCAELLLEQLVSYFVIAISGTHNEETNFDRIELFNKALPVTSKKGDDIKLRTFTIVDDDTVMPLLKDYADSYAAYLRPFAVDEMNDVIALCKLNVFKPETLQCKDNIFNLLQYVSDKQLAAMSVLLDAKDAVKYSKEKYGELKELSSIAGHLRADAYLPVILRNCKLIKELSKKQAKGFNALTKFYGINRHVSAEENPERIAKGLLAEGKVVEAAKVFAKNGALLNRNIKFLLSRASSEELFEIISMLNTDSIASLLQLRQTINQDTEGARTFTFYKNNKVKVHKETDYEAKYRKSVLAPDRAAFLTFALNNKIKEHYANLPKLGKLYINPAFGKIALPLNTSANGLGLGVLPTGSRIKIEGDYIRAFCYWHDVFDIDASLAYQKADGSLDSFYWGNYARKDLGNDVLCSGDARGRDGAEYCDIKLSECEKRGIKYLVYTLNGFGGMLNIGDIHCGYQDKGKLLAKYPEAIVNKREGINPLHSEVWDPKNIEFMVDVKGDSRFYFGFAIDVENREVIVLNLVRDSVSRVLDKNEFNNIKKYLDPDFLSVNMYDAIASRATELVKTPEEADIIFDADYVAVDDSQKVIRPSDISALAKLAAE